MRQLILILLLLTLPSFSSAVEQATLLIENRSAQDVKLVAPGKAMIIKTGSDAVKITFEATDPLGVQLNIWWKRDPLQLCQLFTPWDRKVLITGKSNIACLSKHL